MSRPANAENTRAALLRYLATCEDEPRAIQAVGYLLALRQHPEHRGLVAAACGFLWAEQQQGAAYGS